MKTPSNLLLPILGFCLLLSSGYAPAQVYFDSNDGTAGFGNPGAGTWGTWNTTNTNWTDSGTGGTATVTFGDALTAAANDVVTFDGGAAAGSTVTVAASFSGLQGINVTNFTATSSLTLSGSGTQTLSFASGATVNVATGLTAIISSGSGNGLSLQGNFEKIGGGGLNLGAINTASAYVGTATLSAGNITVSNAGRLGVNSNIVMNGGTLSLSSSVASLTYDIGNLSGASGAISTTSTGGATVEKFLRINQTTAGTYGGTFSQSRPLGIVKQGAADLTLSGNITLSRGIKVGNGVLLINSTTTSIIDNTGAGVLPGIVVQTGGTLGGNGVLTTQSGGIHYGAVVESGGKLMPGLDGVAGLLTFNPGATSSLDISAAVSGANTGALLFDLGSTVDQILLTSGALAFGSGNLGWEDFDFTPLTGLTAGTYTLFDTSILLSGSLSSNLSGAINANWLGQLQVSGDNQDIQLVVSAVPEPSVVLMLSVGLVAVFAFSRRARRS